MISFRILLCTLALTALFVTKPANSEDAPVETPALALLRVAVSEHPEDPDLAWAYARKLAAAGRIDDAIEQTRRFLTRWPDRRPAARVEIARALLDAEAPDAAMRFLDEEVSSDPRSGTARFYRALALRGEGRLAAADREFQLASRLEPSLRSETLLARALGLFDLGREEEAVDLLLVVLRLDPTGNTATRARLLLRQREITTPAARLSADAYIGFEWDDNVTLESAENESPASDREDFRGVWGVGGAWRAWNAERSNLLIGYRYDQSEYDELDAFSLLSNTLFASGSWRATERIALRLDAIGYTTLQDLDHELSGGSIRPSLLISLGPDWGALRFFTKFEVAEYADHPLFTAWERDANTYSLGLEHFLPLRMPQSWLSFSGSWERTLTQAEARGAARGFDGDYDYDSLRARGLATLALPLFDLRTRIEASYTHDRYHNDNLSHFLASGGGFRKREDDILVGRLGLSGPIIDHVRLEVYWRGTRRISNVDIFEYDKQVVGAVLQFSTD